MDKSLQDKIKLLRQQPIFSSLSTDALQNLAKLLRKKNYLAGSMIVKQGDLVNSIYILRSGIAEVWVMPAVTGDISSFNDAKLVAKLGASESIGLNREGLFSQTGARTATVVAATDVVCYQLTLEDIYQFQLEYPEVLKSIKDSVMQAHRMDFVKKLFPFKDLQVKQLHELIKNTYEINIDANRELFHENDKPDNCYFILSGSIKIINNEGRQIALLKEHDIVGETGIVLSLPRNATAITHSKCQLLVLRGEELINVMRKYQQFSLTMLYLIRSRSRPSQASDIIVYTQISKIGYTNYLLKNPRNLEIYSLSEEGYYLWNEINGQQDLNSIIKKFSAHTKSYNSAAAINLIMELAEFGFVNLRGFSTKHHRATLKFSTWLASLRRIPQMMDISFCFSNVDVWLEKTLPYFKWFFTKPCQIILGAVAIAGLIAFFIMMPKAVSLLEKVSLYHFWILYPLFLLTLSIHEFSHAYATKYFGYNVKSMGIGWFWMGPAAYCDTTDTLLASRRTRLIVNSIGVYVQAICASFGALISLFSNSPHLITLSWGYALLCYINIFMNLDPIIDLDGYYILEDISDELNLRNKAVRWLTQSSWRNLFNPSYWLKSRVALYYWGCALLFNILIIPMLWWFQLYILGAYFDIFHNVYLRTFLSLSIIFFSTVSVWAEIQAESAS